MYFDSHAHYDDTKFDSDRSDLLTNLKEVDCIINCGADLNSSEKSLQLADKFDFIYAAVGIHPENVESENDIDKLKNFAAHKKVKAIGEIGLDYHYENFSRDKQIELFKKQIALANEINLPIIIHSRDAQNDTFQIIKECAKTNGVIHCYSGNLQMALEYIKLGFYIGIGGVITFKNAKKLAEVVEQIPLEKILIETDCPYLSPEPNRGKRNDSSNLKYVVEKISQLKNISHDEVAKITEDNAKKLFQINF